MAYTDQAAIEAYLGRALTGPEAAMVEIAADAASEWIEGKTQRSFGVAGAITDEQHILYGPTIRLGHTPVTSITSVFVRAQDATSQPFELSASDGYYLQDPVSGKLLIGGSRWMEQPIVTVSYLAGGSLPVSVQLAATMLAASHLARHSAAPEVLAGIKQYAIQGDISVTFADSAANGSTVPPAVMELLEPYMPRRKLFA